MTADIRPADFEHPSVLALLDLHFRRMHEQSPAGLAFALDLSGLQRSDISVWVLWEGDRATAVGALKRLSETAGEIKSMRVHPDRLGRGLGAAMLAHIIAQARDLGLKRLSLETGSGPAFEPALNLYRRRGFVDGEPFADYRPSPFNQFLHLSL
jgi:putative acetyltransferase